MQNQPIFNFIAAQALAAQNAIDEGIELYADPCDPFESVRDFVDYPEARKMIAIGWKG